MCRLLAYGSGSDRSVTELLGDDGFASLKSLSSLHGDGWGMAWSAAMGGGRGAPVDSRRSTLRALLDPAFDELAREPLGRAGLVHLRWATLGFAVRDENTHPFLFDGWAFAHNGSIPEADRLDGLLSPPYRAQRRGDTDSERYFLHVVERIEQSGDVVTAICEAVSDIRAVCGTGSLNAVLLSPTTLAVVHGRAGMQPPREHLLAAVADEADLPPGHLDRYYELRYRINDDALVVASMGVFASDWIDVPEDSVLVADFERSVVSIHSLEDPSDERSFALPGVAPASHGSSGGKPSALADRGSGTA